MVWFLLEKGMDGAVQRAGVFAAPALTEMQSEVVRKGIHFLIALSPGLASINRPLTAALLAGGTLLYICLESLRMAGIRLPLISLLTDFASRQKERGHFVLGPVTLGLGALLALLCYSPMAAAIAIYALAFGDGFASLAGKCFGRLRPAFMAGKSVEGSLACFCMVFIAAYGVSYSGALALAAALTAAFTEALPLEDYDNVALPLMVGLAVQLGG